MAQTTVTNSSPITSVPQGRPQSPPQNPTSLLPSRLLLELRDTQIEVDRETLINLPESILIVMFPNGVVLSKNAKFSEQAGENSHPAERNRHIVFVDFSPAMFQFILDFYSNMGQERAAQTSIPDLSQLFGILPGPSSPFTGKQPFVVLREELDYFSMPSDGGSENNKPPPLSELNSQFPLKSACAEHLLKNLRIFDAFERNIHGGNNLAERQLVDMLCLSGFTREDDWGYRCVEPSRATLVSISLVPLNANDEAIRAGVTQKLLLFWRKPARKCWWDIEEVKLSILPEAPIKLWSRRIWTLELALL